MNLIANQAEYGKINVVRFNNRSLKSWVDKNNIEMYSTHNEGESVVSGIYVRTLKNKIYKYMTPTSKNVYIDKLDDNTTINIIEQFK